MPTYSALTTLPGEAAAQALGAALEGMEPEPWGVGVFEIEDGSGLWEVGTYFTDPPDDTALALLAAAHGAKPFAVSEVPDIDWVAHVKRELRPVVAGRFYVHGAHDADTVPDGVTALRIEAAMAFGTGHHGTTQGCLLAIEDLATEGAMPRRVADIGAGTAVLAMAAATVWPDARIIASDIDQVATDTASANCAENGLGDRVDCITAEGFDHADLAAGAPFDLILANILMGPLVALAPQMAENLVPGGDLVLSGILNEQADTVSAAYGAAGVAETSRRVIGDWTTLRLARK